MSKPAYVWINCHDGYDVEHAGMVCKQDIALSLFDVVLSLDVDLFPHQWKDGFCPQTTQ